ncbi:hypothetical protein ACWKWP_03480 [Agromyces soli]
MDWTFWVGIGVIAVAWVVTQWAFSFRRHAEKRRGPDPEQASAIVDVERQREQGRSGAGYDTM